MRYISLLVLAILIACTCIIYATSTSYEGMKNAYPFTSIKGVRRIAKTHVTEVISYGRPFFTVNWVKISIPSRFANTVYGSCILGRYVIFVGVAYENYFSKVMGYAGYAHIEVRYRSTGDLVNEWTDTEQSVFYNCITIDDKIYVVGGEREPNGTAHWVIYVFDKNLHVLRKIVGVEGVATSIVTDGKYVYVGGWEYKDGVFMLRVEKRRLDDLSLVKSVDIYYSSWLASEVYSVALYDMAINPVTGDIWAVGHYYSQVYGEVYGLIIILDKNLNIVREVSYPQVYPKGICFNSMGRAYIVTPRHVLSFDKYGTFMGITDSSNGTKILCIGNYVITFSYIRNMYKTCFDVSLLDSNLNLLSVACLGLSNFTIYGIGIGKPAFDGSNIYVGFIGDGAWVLYSLHVNITRQAYSLPDLTIRDLEIYPQSPIAWQTVTISFKICNIGNAPASNVEWILYINNITYEKGVIDYLASSTCIPENVTVTLEGGIYNIKVIVNPYNIIRELNTTNNIAQEKVYVRYRTYKTYGNWILLGNATVENGKIILTQDTNYQVGAAWYMIPINFSYNFYAKLIVYLGSNPYGADGITFVIARDPLQLGGRGGSLGYAAGCWEGICFHGVLNSIAVEIDTFQNIPLNDPFEDHIAIDVNASVVHTGKFPVVEIGNVEDGKEHILEIFWNAKNETLTVKFDGRIVINNFRINLYKYIKGDVGYIAVTGATGAAYNLQYFRPVVLKYTMASVARVCIYKLGSESLYTPPNLTELGKFVGCTYVNLRKLWFWITFWGRDVPANWTNVFAFVSHDVNDNVYTIPPPWARKLVHDFREVALDIMFGINVTVPGKYLVETYSDDGVWVKIGNNVVIDD